jgi:cytochrome c553
LLSGLFLVFFPFSAMTLHSLSFAARLLGMACAATSLNALAQPTEVQAGRQKAQMCSVCHGPAGLAQAPDTPHLAGQPAIYLTAQLRAYRSGGRKHEVMAVLAKALSDDDIFNLAAWYSSIKVEAQLPP